MERRRLELESLFSPLDMALGKARELFFGKYRLLTVSLAILLYAGQMLLLGPGMGVSSNYFVILPVLAVSVAYGLAAGTISGALGLPANLFFYSVIGHPGFAPESKLMAELSGVIVGMSFGYLSDYYRKLARERSIRKEIEDELRRALRDKEILFREVHHRVKNNLNLVKSVIGLQSRRSKDRDFVRAAQALAGRIVSISMIHERLYRTAELSNLAIDEYLGDVARGVLMGAGSIRDGAPGQSGQEGKAPILDMACTKRELSMDVAVPLGLIVNEAMTNALKHAVPDDGQLRISVCLRREGDRFALDIADNGRSFEPLAEGECMDITAASERYASSLGLTLVRLLADQLGATCLIERANGQSALRLSFPAHERPAEL